MAPAPAPAYGSPPPNTAPAPAPDYGGPPPNTAPAPAPVYGIPPPTAPPGPPPNISYTQGPPTTAASPSPQPVPVSPSPQPVPVSPSPQPVPVSPSPQPVPVSPKPPPPGPPAVRGCDPMAGGVTVPTPLGGNFTFAPTDTLGCVAWKLARAVCVQAPVRYRANAHDSGDWACPVSGGFGGYCAVPGTQLVCTGCPGYCNANCMGYASGNTPLTVRGCSDNETVVQLPGWMGNASDWNGTLFVPQPPPSPPAPPPAVTSLTVGYNRFINQHPLSTTTSSTSSTEVVSDATGAVVSGPQQHQHPNVSSILKVCCLILIHFSSFIVVILLTHPSTTAGCACAVAPPPKAAVPAAQPEAAAAAQAAAAASAAAIRAVSSSAAALPGRAEGARCARRARAAAARRSALRAAFHRVFDNRVRAQRLGRRRRRGQRHLPVVHGGRVFEAAQRVEQQHRRVGGGRRAHLERHGAWHLRHVHPSVRQCDRAPRRAVALRRGVHQLEHAGGAAAQLLSAGGAGCVEDWAGAAHRGAPGVVLLLRNRARHGGASRRAQETTTQACEACEDWFSKSLMLCKVVLQKTC